MIVGSAIVLWLVAVAVTCAMCIAAARADAESTPGDEAETPEPAVTPELLA